MSSLSTNNIITLNVGGKVYAAAVDTLRRYPSSTLGQMFTTNQRVGKTVFIDGDGRMFRYILNFLRRNELLLPSDFKEYDLLLAEAKVFQIQPIIEKIEEKKRNFENSRTMEHTVLLVGNGTFGYVNYYCVQIRGTFTEHTNTELSQDTCRQSVKDSHRFEAYAEVLEKLGFDLVDGRNVLTQRFWMFEMQSRGVLPSDCNFARNTTTVYELWSRWV